MVIDHLSNAHLYRPLNPRIAQALDFLSRADLATLKPERHELEGDRIYALVSEYVSKPPEEGRWEAHRRYIDLQCVAKGRERVGYAQVDRLIAEAYDEAKDMTWLADA